MTKGSDARSASSIESRRTTAVTTLGVLYIHLWVIEGAIRKWIPTLDSAAYFARDLVLIIGLFVIFALYGPPRDRVRWTAVLWALIAAAIILASIDALRGSAPPAVAIAGARNYLTPLILPIVLIRDGALNFARRGARAILLWLPIEAVLTVIQVMSPRSSAINLQTGGEEAYFTTANGIVRASGTFSAPAGLILFATVGLACGIAVVAGSVAVNRLLGWAGLISAVVLVVLGGSRGAIATSSVVLAGWILHSLLSGKFRSVVLAVLIAAGAALVFWVATSSLPDVFNAFLLRFENAAQDENTVARVQRTVLGFTDVQASVFGSGLGYHSTIGIALGSPGPWFEVDSERWVAELGVVGLVLAWVRLICSGILAVWLVANLRRVTVYSAMLGAALVQSLAMGSITTQPSTQGYFAILLSLFACSIIANRNRCPAEPVPFVTSATAWGRV